jgi:thiamine biosynthesis lipoprotein
VPRSKHSAASCGGPAPVLFLILWLPLLVGACTRPPEAIQLQGETMGTSYSVTVAARPDAVGRSLIEAVVQAVLSEVDAHLSTWNPDSEISALNSAEAERWFPVSPMLLEVLDAARTVSLRTQGCFDVTVAPLVQLWGFDQAAGDAWSPPSDEALAAARSASGFDKLEIDTARGIVRKRIAELRVDVGAFVPGYAVDLIAQRFIALGVENFLVEIGGEVRTLGLNSAGRPWRIAIEAPLAAERRPYAIVEPGHLGVSTSGDYRDFRITDGRRFSHTIDPRSGLPVEHGLASVTVLHESTMLADAYATALMVLGPEAGLQLAEQLGLVALLLVRSDEDGGFREIATASFGEFRRPLG